jgi:poly-beta-hydroxyalkanoate depolymerase
MDWEWIKVYNYQCFKTTSSIVRSLHSQFLSVSSQVQIQKISAQSTVVNRIHAQITHPEFRINKTIMIDKRYKLNKDRCNHHAIN